MPLYLKGKQTMLNLVDKLQSENASIVNPFHYKIISR